MSLRDGRRIDVARGATCLRAAIRGDESDEAEAGYELLAEALLRICGVLTSE